MKARTLFVAVLCFLGSAAARAAAPTVQAIQIDSAVMGGNAVLSADVRDSDGDLVSTTFFVAGPGVDGSIVAGAVSVSGTQAFPQVLWSPPQAGIYTVWVQVFDSTDMGSQVGTFESAPTRLVVPPVTIGSGGNTMYLDSGEIVTTQNDTSANVVAQSGGNLIFWAGVRVVLKPGFHAYNGSSFWAAVDHNMNGYSDLEEATDSDGDGMPDAWEIDHGLNPFSSADASLDSDGDGLTNLQEYQSGRDPHNAADSGSIQLVLRTPSNVFYGVNTSNWAISNCSR
jgi:hypothetical protein